MMNAINSHKLVRENDPCLTDILSTLRNVPVEIEPQPVDFKKIAAEAIQSLRYMAGAESVRIDLAIAEGETFFSDHNCLFSIFSNLLSNAIRYRDKDKLSFIKITAAFDDNGAVAVFEDNGIGIDEPLQKKVFDKFFRVNQEYGGSGLGLSIVKSSVEKLGGSIRIVSRLGEGTIFTLQLPNLLV